MYVSEATVNNSITAGVLLKHSEPIRFVLCFLAKKFLGSYILEITTLGLQDSSNDSRVGLTKEKKKGNKGLDFRFWG